MAMSSHLVFRLQTCAVLTASLYTFRGFGTVLNVVNSVVISKSHFLCLFLILTKQMAFLYRIKRNYSKVNILILVFI